jgi:hypothetical protein
VDVLLSSALSKGETQSEVIQGVSTWLKRMTLAEKLEVRQIGRSTRYEVVVHRQGVAANLRDVGIGISQVLPGVDFGLLRATGQHDPAGRARNSPASLGTGQAG